MEKLFRSLGRAWAEARWLDRPRPLIVAYAITDRCNRRCAFCRLGDRRSDELDAGQALAVVEELGTLGCRQLSFTGGEPLLREDLGVLLERARALGMRTKVNSNGALVPRRRDVLGLLDLLVLSLDGPAAIHDRLRGAGSYDEVMTAASLARERGIPVAFGTVVTRENAQALHAVLDTAARFQARVLFQPAALEVRGAASANPVAPDADANRTAFAALEDAKRSRPRTVANSRSGLEHLGHFPRPWPLVCASGRISCRIEPDGAVTHCGVPRRGHVALNCREVGVERAFLALPPIVCDDCWCAGRVELNLSWSFRLEAIVNQLAQR